MTVKTIQKIKICGLYFCSDCGKEYDLNVHKNIKKLSYKIVKTFGLSQLIYNMQSATGRRK